MTEREQRKPPKKPKKPVYFCFDCEASGPVPGLYSMISFGVCALTERPDGGFDLGPELYLELKPSFPGVEAEAMEVNGLDLEVLARDGLDAKEALRRLTAFAEAHTPEGHRPIFVGHNAPFDWMMACYYYRWAGLRNPFGYSAIDSKAFAMGLFGLSWADTNKAVLPGLLEIDPEDKSVKHRADYDARFQAEIFRGLLKKHREVACREGRAGA